MTRKWSARLVALGGLTLALGCRSGPGAPVVTSPPITTPLLPEMVVPGPAPLPPGPPVSPPLSPTLAPIPPAVSLVPKPTPAPITPPDTLHPSLGDATPAPPLIPVPGLAKAPTGPEPEGPALPLAAPPADVTPPKDLVPVLTSNPKPARTPAPAPPPDPKPVVKPLLVEAPRPPAGLDGFAPAPRVPDLPPADDSELPKIVNGTPPAPPLPIAPGEKYGRAPDYRWLAGVMDRHAKGGFWTLRYADAGADDQWGGKVRLMEDPRLRDFRDGDLVYVEGELVAPPKSAADAAAYPPFRVSDVRRFEPAK